MPKGRAYSHSYQRMMAMVSQKNCLYVTQSSEFFHSQVHTTLFVTTALVTKQFVLTSNCPYPGGPVQSQCSDWLPMALSLHQECSYIECPYKESLLYASSCAACMSQHTSLASCSLTLEQLLNVMPRGLITDFTYSSSLCHLL